MDTKVCRLCHENKPTSEFYPAGKDRPGKFYPYCKPCQRAKTARVRATPPALLRDDGLKLCQMCKTPKEPVEFHNCKTTYDGKNTYCKSCAADSIKRNAHKHRDRNAALGRKWRAENPERFKDHCRKQNYGVPMGTYAKMLEDQGGRCAICKTENAGGRGAFHIDHCHESGNVRGLLCHHCNIGLGHFSHDPTKLSAAISYLAESSRESGS